MKYNDRVEYLTSACEGKSVLHIGCCGLIKKLDDNTEINSHIHHAIAEKADICFGLDVDNDELEEMRIRNYTNLFFGDVSKEFPPALKDRKFDIIFFGNMFNYLTNPIKCLNEARNYLSDTGRIIITVNNCLSLRSYMRLLFRKHDPAFRHHVYNYSPNTSRELLKSINAKDLKISYAWHGRDIFYKQRLVSRLLTMIMKLFVRNRNLSDTLILDFRL